MTNKDPVEQFQTRLRKRCTDYARQYGYKQDLGRGFEGYVAHLFSQERGFQEVLEGQDTSDADLGDAILRNNDLGVDLVLEDSENRQLLLVQAKWLGKSTNFPYADLQSFLSLHSKLCEPEFVATGGDMARELLGSYRDKVKDKYTMTFRFVINRPLPEELRWKAICDTANREHQENDNNVICEIFGQSELKEIEHQLASTDAGILDDIRFAVKENDAVEIDSPKHSLICRISGNELTNLYNQHKQKLFALNIRLPMGLRRAINKEIQATAETQPSDFFYYNNGVSAVCSEFSYDRKQNAVSANRFQIINGAQTVGAIAGANTTEDVAILFRLTATADEFGGQFTDNIIRYNNTQNPIQASDFRANDRIQSFLKNHLGKRAGRGAAPSFIYQPKRGARKSGQGGWQLTSDQFARIRYSFLYDPVRTYKEPKLLFDSTDSGLYWSAFGSDRFPVDSWTEDELDEATVAITLDYHFKEEGKELKKELRDSRTTNNRLTSIDASEVGSYGEANYLYRLSRYLVGLVAVGLRVHYGATFESYHEVLSSRTRFYEITEDLIEDAKQIVRFEMTHRTASRSEAQPDYNLARDLKAWDKLDVQMQGEAKSRLRRVRRSNSARE